MQKMKSVKLNFIMNSILTMSSFIFPLITFPYISRILLPAGTGKVSFATAVVSYFSMFAQLGIPTYGIRACAKVRDDKEKLSRTVQEIVLINIIMMVIIYVMFFAAVACVPRFRQDKTLFCIASATIFFNCIGVEWLYKGLEQYTYITIRSIIFKIIGLIFMFTFVHRQRDYIIYGAVLVLASAGSGILNFINVHRYISMKPVGLYNLKPHLKAVFIFFAMSVATTIYTNMDNVMLGFLSTDSDVGYYSAAIKIKCVLTSIVTALGSVLLPRSAYYLEQKDIKKFLHLSQKALNFVVLMACPLGLYFAIFAHEGIIFLSGNHYAKAILPMQIIMPVVLLIGLSNIMGMQMLVPMGLEKKVLYSEIAGSAVDLIINLTLIPKLGVVGSAVATLCAELTVTVIQFIALHEIVISMLKTIRYDAVILALVLGAGVSFGFKFLYLPEFPTLFISATVFFGIYSTVLCICKVPLAVQIKDQVWQKLLEVKNKKSVDIINLNS